MSSPQFSHASESTSPLVEKGDHSLETARRGARGSLWVGLLIVGLVCGMSYGWRLGSWPWDVDELSSLEEMGLLDPEIRTTVDNPDSIVVRLPRLVPVWYGVQRAFLIWVPRNEWWTRVLPALWGVLAVVGLYAWGWHWRGPMFAPGLALLAGASPLMLWLAQQNRFYTMAVLCIVLAMTAIWNESKHWAWLVWSVLWTLLAVFTHNVAIVLFGLQGVVAAGAWILRGGNLGSRVRAVVCGAIAAVVYGVHVRPIAGDWTGAGFTWAPPWASFVAHVGMPTVVLALLGSWLILVSRKQRAEMAVWAVLTGAVLLFVVLTPWLMPVWNPRYSLLWILPLWVTGALAVEIVAQGMLHWIRGGLEQAAVVSSSSSGRQAGGSEELLYTCSKLPRFSHLLAWLVVIGWYGSVGLLLTPKWVSHWVDGTRHDYRQAAEWVAQHLGALPTQGTTPGQGDIASPRLFAGQSLKGDNRQVPLSDTPILTNMELQMRYYLPKLLRSQCRYWVPSMPLPSGECVVVLGGNGWEEPLVVPGRTVQWVASVGHRRFDELSHVVRIYQVGPAGQKQNRQSRPPDILQ